MESKIDCEAHRLVGGTHFCALGTEGDLLCWVAYKHHCQLVEQPQDADLREKIARAVGQHAENCEWEGCSASEQEAAYRETDWILKCVGAAGYHKCPKEEKWPVLTDDEISTVVDSAPIPCPMEFKDEPKIRALLQAQRDADMKRCPAQEGK